MDKDHVPKYFWETFSSKRATHLIVFKNASSSLLRFSLLVFVQGTKPCAKLIHIYQWGVLTQQFFISPFLSDDVIRAPDLRLAAATTRCTPEALPHFCWASATTQWDRMRSQRPCFLHPGLYRSLEPTCLPQAVSTVPAPCTVVQTYRWEWLLGTKELVIRKSEKD